MRLLRRLRDYTTSLDSEKSTRRRFAFTITRTRRQRISLSVSDLQARCPVCDQDVEFSLSNPMTEVPAPEPLGCALPHQGDLLKLNAPTTTKTDFSREVKGAPIMKSKLTRLLIPAAIVFSLALVPL